MLKLRLFGERELFIFVFLTRKSKASIPSKKNKKRKKRVKLRKMMKKRMLVRKRKKRRKLPNLNGE